MTECKLNAGEAVFGFITWLTGRERVVTMSSKTEVPEVLMLFERYQKANNLPGIGDDWPKNLVIPEKTDEEINDLS